MLNLTNNKDVLTTGEVASICKVAARTVSKWIDSGRLEGYRIPGSRDRRVTRDALESFIRKHGLPNACASASRGLERVVVVDADTATADTLAAALAQAAQREVRTANTAFEAGVAVERFSPHWVIADTSVGMSELCGLLGWLQSERSTTRVAVMGQGFTPADELALRAAGARAIIRKPFTLRAVVELIHARAAMAG